MVVSPTRVCLKARKPFLSECACDEHIVWREAEGPTEQFRQAEFEEESDGCFQNRDDRSSTFGLGMIGLQKDQQADPPVPIRLSIFYPNRSVYLEFP